MSHSAGYGGSTSLVTGDAVPLDLRPAGFASRAVAFGIDFLVQFAALVASFLTLALLTKGNLDEALPVAIGLTLTVLTVVGYPVAFETLSRGAASASSPWACGSSVRTARRCGSGSLWPERSPRSWSSGCRAAWSGWPARW